MPKISKRRASTNEARRFRLGDWMNAPEWITVREAAQLSGYDPEYIRRLIRNKKIVAEKRGGHDYWIVKSSVQDYIKAMKSLGTDKHNPHRNTQAQK